ncbi:MAG: endonuclease domain-containing protein [Angustibacter sp.]
MPRPRRPRDPLPDVFIGSHAVAAGLLTVRQLRGPHVARILHGVYRPAWVPLTHQLKCRAACLVLPEAAVITGRSAATVLGLPLAGASDDVAVAVPHGAQVPRHRGIALRRLRERAPGGRLLDGVRLAQPRRIAFDAAAGHRLPEATAVLDALVRHEIVDIDDLRQWLVDCHDNHVVGLREAAALVDARAESQPESITRVHLRKAGFDVVPQFRVVVDSRVVARVDLALPELKIAVEYDGRWHEAGQQRALDNERIARLRAAGWIVIIVTAELLRDPRALVATVAAAVAERRS